MLFDKSLNSLLYLQLSVTILQCFFIIHHEREFGVGDGMSGGFFGIFFADSCSFAGTYLLLSEMPLWVNPYTTTFVRKRKAAFLVR
jgi:hypothetical protein